jgi:hypothetical protein
LLNSTSNRLNVDLDKFSTTDDTIRLVVEVKHAGNRNNGEFAMLRYMEKLGDRGIDATGLVIAGGDVSVVETDPATGLIEVVQQRRLLSDWFITFLRNFLE